MSFDAVTRRIVPFALVAALGAGALTGCGGGGEDSAAAAFKPAPPDSTWVPGQPSLLALAPFRAIGDRAAALGDLRLAAHEMELARIQAAREAAAKKAREDALRKYREARRKALAKYRAALRRAARLRALQRKRLAALREKRRRQLAALRRKLRVKPGEECTIPEVAAQFHCSTGMTPLKHPLPKK